MFIVSLKGRTKRILVWGKKVERQKRKKFEVKERVGLQYGILVLKLIQFNWKSTEFENGFSITKICFFWSFKLIKHFYSFTVTVKSFEYIDYYMDSIDKEKLHGMIIIYLGKLLKICWIIFSKILLLISVSWKCSL